MKIVVKILHPGGFDKMHIIPKCIKMSHSTIDLGLFLITENSLCVYLKSVLGIMGNSK